MPGKSHPSGKPVPASSRRFIEVSNRREEAGIDNLHP